MTKPAKLYLNLLANPRQIVSFREFEAMLVAFGFRLDRVTGSHRVYENSRALVTVTINPRGKDAQPYQVREFCAIVAAKGLKVDR